MDNNQRFNGYVPWDSIPYKDKFGVSIRRMQRPGTLQQSYNQAMNLALNRTIIRIPPTY